MEHAQISTIALQSSKVGKSDEGSHLESLTGRSSGVQSLRRGRPRREGQNSPSVLTQGSQLGTTGAGHTRPRLLQKKKDLITPEIKVVRTPPGQDSGHVEILAGPGSRCVLTLPRPCRNLCSQSLLSLAPLGRFRGRIRLLLLGGPVHFSSG